MTEISLCSKKGKRSSMEDRHVVNTDLLNDKSLQLYAVFDGHGGSIVVNLLEKNFEPVLREIIVKEKQLSNNVVDFEKALQRAFELCEDIINSDFEKRLDDGRFSTEDSGSTAAVILVVENREIICANVGDTEVVLGNPSRPITVLTTQHKPNVLSEQNRIKSAGGFVTMSGLPRVNGSLAVSRAFGNCHLKKIVNAVPSIAKCPVSDGDVLILACDGLWDVFKYDEAVKETFDFMTSHNNELKNCAAFLTDTAIDTRCSSDNVSAIVLRFVGNVIKQVDSE